MKTPKKLYVVISETACWKPSGDDVFINADEAKKEASFRNMAARFPEDDWRVERYVPE